MISIDHDSLVFVDFDGFGDGCRLTSIQAITSKINTDYAMRKRYRLSERVSALVANLIGGAFNISVAHAAQVKFN